MNFLKTFDRQKICNSIIHLTAQMQYPGMTGKRTMKSGNERQKEFEGG